MSATISSSTQASHARNGIAKQQLLADALNNIPNVIAALQILTAATNNPVLQVGAQPIVLLK